MMRLTHRRTSLYGLGLSGLALVAAACNQPPTGPEVRIEPAEPTTLEDLQVVFDSEPTDPNDDPISIVYAWEVREPGGASFVTADFQGETVPAGRTEKGQSWRVTVTVTDGETTAAVTEEASAEVTIANTPAEITEVRITPLKGVDTFGTLTATASADDVDGDQPQIDLTWYVDGTALDVEGNRLTGEFFDKNQEVWVEAVAVDGASESEPVASNRVTIANTPPSIEGAVIGPEELVEDAILTCEPVGWFDADGDMPNIDVAWIVNGVEVATTPTIDGARFGRDDLIRCQATPNDGDDTGEPRMSPVVVIDNTRPVLGGVTIDDTTPQATDSQTFSLVDPYDADGDEISVSAKWYVNGELVHEGEVLPDRTFVKGDKLTVEVTPTDGQATGKPVMSAPVTAINSPPVLSGITLEPSPLYTDSTLFPSVTVEDVDGDRISYTTAWSVNSAAVSASGSTLDGLTWFDRGDTVSVTITPNDGDTDGAPLTSEVVEVVNKPPTNPPIGVTPEEPAPEEDFTCFIADEPVDADGDDIEVTISWTRNGASFTATDTVDRPGDTIRADETVDLDDFVCTVTITDGFETLTQTQLVEVRKWRGPRVFTPCGASGYRGPSASACELEYEGTPIANDELTVSGGIQTWTVPFDGTYRIEAWGAQGGSGSSSGVSGHRGARLRGDFDLLEGDEIDILVGQSGQTGSSYSAGGGGGTFVVLNGTDVLMAAAGGGAAGRSNFSACAGQAGGSARSGTSSSWTGCSTSSTSSGFGAGYGTSGSSYYGGGGAGYMGDGTAWESSARADAYTRGGEGSNWFGDGGFGGGGGGGYCFSSWLGGTSCSSFWGSGGGGGYTGGGGHYYAGGGGGSLNTGDNQSNSSNAQTGNGEVEIDLLPE
jgi:hypothetical protein